MRLIEARPSVFALAKTASSEPCTTPLPRVGSRLSRSLVPLLVLGAALLSAGAQGQTTDAAPGINSEIAAALKAGQKVYTLPAGTVILQTPIVVPAGTTGFTLQGSPLGTLIRTPNVQLGSAIQVGQSVSGGNNWGVTNQPNLAASRAAEGESTVTLSVSTAPVVGASYFLYDKYWQAHKIYTTTGVMPHGEVVRVVSYDPTTRKVTLDKALGRTFGTGASLAYVDKLLTRNVTIKDIQFDGMNDGGTTGSGGLVSVSLADGAILSNLNVRNFIGWGVSASSSRNVNISNVQVTDALATGPGDGYGITASRCRFVQISNCYTNKTRHGYVFHMGTMDATVSDSTCAGSNFDTHGMDERRITFRNCDSDFGLAFGNEAWLDGEKGMLVDGCRLGRLFINPGARGVRVTGTTFASLYVSGAEGTQLNADDVRIENSVLKGDCFLIQGVRRAGRIEFVNSRLESTVTTWGTIFSLTNLEVDLRLSHCEFRAASARSWDPSISVTGASAATKLSVSYSRFVSLGGNVNAVQIPAGSLATVQLMGNTFYTVKRLNPVFLNNLGSGTVTNYGNSSSTVQSWTDSTLP